METLICQHGDHPWEREDGKRGKKPLYCPEHKPVPPSKVKADNPYAHLQAGKKRKASAERQKKILALISHHRADSCHCGITVDTTDEELRAMGGGCTDPQWVCPTLLSVRQAVTVKPKAKKEEDE